MYSPSATRMRSPATAFSSAWKGSRRGASRVPSPSAEPDLTNQSRPAGRCTAGGAMSMTGTIESRTIVAGCRPPGATSVR